MTMEQLRGMSTTHQKRLIFHMLELPLPSYFLCVWRLPDPFVMMPCDNQGANN